MGAFAADRVPADLCGAGLHRGGGETRAAGSAGNRAAGNLRESGGAVALCGVRVGGRFAGSGSAGAGRGALLASDIVGALGIDFSRLLGFSRGMQNLCENQKSENSLPGSDQSSPPKKPRPAGATGGRADGRGRKPQEIPAGTRFGRLVVVGRHTAGRNRNSCWLCLCDCGVELPVLGYNLKNGNTKSCGCLQSDFARTFFFKHGLTATAIHRSWSSMKSRCLNPDDQFYPRYGGRGITVSEAWLEFENFYADMHPRPPGSSLDRIDNNLGYSKENCRWATSTQQNRNRRSNRIITFGGKAQCIAAWAEELGWTYRTITTS